jgi:putative membrane protein
MRWLRGFTKYQLVLMGTFLVVWVVLAIKPATREFWLLENALVAIFVPFALATARYFRLSDFSYTLITIYLLLHLVGSHYDYSEVPFGSTMGQWLGDERNYYDRLVHFSFGFLMAYPMREVFHRVASVRGFWGYLLPLEMTLSLSAVYEILEWLVAISIDPEAGISFLGSQGDPWDAIKDMALAGSGALITMCVVAAINWHYDPTFWHEMYESLRVKNQRPLGEVRLAELIAARRKQTGDTTTEAVNLPGERPESG